MVTSFFIPPPLSHPLKLRLADQLGLTQLDPPSNVGDHQAVAVRIDQPKLTLGGVEPLFDQSGGETSREKLLTQRGDIIDLKVEESFPAEQESPAPSVTRDSRARIAGICGHLLDIWMEY